MTTSKHDWTAWAREQAAAWNLEGELKAERQALLETGKALSAPEAIRRHCLQCKGYHVAEIRWCDDNGCWLHPWRNGEAIHGGDGHGTPGAAERNEGTLPTGRYTALLCGSDMIRTRRNGRCLALTFRVIEGECKDRIIRCKLFLEHFDWGRRNEALEDLHSICRAVGILTPHDSSELHGIPLVLHVEQKQDRGGRMCSVIEAYERLQTKAVSEIAQKAASE